MQDLEDSTALASDDLGETGEALFKNLCARTGLNCIKSDRDRTGWDFVVEFPFARAGGIDTLDQRQKTTCNVQLKSTAIVGKRSISLKLSAADLLAKDSHPAFIVVFMLTKTGEPLRGYLIHLLDDALLKLLKRLRQVEVSGRHDTHNLTISFEFRKFAKPFNLTPTGLKETLALCCGESPLSYADEKVRQLNELGYDGPELRSEFEFQVKDEAHFSQALLGMVPVEPIKLQTFDVRFGIPAPYKGDLFKTVKGFFLTPEKGQDCIVTAKGPFFEPSASFQAELFAPPPIDGRFRLRVNYAGFNLTVVETETQIVANCSYSLTAAPLAEIVQIFRAMNYIMAGNARVSVAPIDGAWEPIDLPLGKELTSDGPGDLPRVAKFTASWHRLLEHAGLPSSTLISWDDLWEKDAHIAVELMFAASPSAHFEFDADGISVDCDEVVAIYFNNASVAGEAVHYAIEVTLTRDPADPGRFRSSAFRPLEARPYKIDLDAYSRDLATRYDFRVCIHPKNLQSVQLGRKSAFRP